MTSLCRFSRPMMTRTVCPSCRSFSHFRAQSSQSFVQGTTDVPLLEHTFPEFFERELLARYAERIALVSMHEPRNIHNHPRPPARWESSQYLRWSFEDLDSHVAALSRGLVKLGVQRGDRVGVVMGNNSFYGALQWACARIGAVLVTINPAYKMTEMIGAMNLAGVSTLFITPRLRSSDYVSLLRNAMPSVTGLKLEDPAAPSLRSIVLVDNLSHTGGDFASAKDNIPVALDYRELFVWREDDATKGVVDALAQSLNNDDVVNLQFTSGTTGAPKAVSLTHKNLLNNGYSIGSCMRLTPDDKISNLGSWTHGSAILYSAESHNAKATLRALEEERCTGVHGVPTHFLDLLGELDRSRREEGKRWDLSSLRTGIAAGSTVPIDLMQQLIKKLNLTDLTNAYGMTETSPVSFQTIPEDPLDKRTETVGRIQPHVVAKIVDPQNKIVPRGSPGELCVSGYLLHKGYWNDPEHSAAIIKREADPNGVVRDWLYTGDEAILDDEGYLRIVGRLKDLIIRGGENLFPVQIENVLTAHPRIREAAVVAVPDAKFGEAVGVWIVRETEGEDDVAEALELGPNDVRSWVRSKMNPQNAPAHVWFFDSSELNERGYTALPKTGSGKVQKNILREWSKALAKDGIGRVEVPAKAS